MKQFAKVAMVNLALLLAGLLVMELIFGSWVKPHNKLNQLNLLRSAQHRFDVSDLYKSDKPVITYTRDKYGFRTTTPNQPHTFDIVTLGGSTTEQRFISDEDTWQRVLEQQLAAAGKPTIVANAGIDGQSTYGHIKNFEWWFPQVPGLKPKYYLFYIGINDMYIDEGSLYDKMGADSTTARGWKQTIADNSALYAAMRRLRGWQQAKHVRGVDHRHIQFDTVRYTTTPLASGYSALMAPRLVHFAGRIQTLIGLAKKSGATPIFVSQPAYIYHWQGNTLHGAAEPFLYDGVAVNGVDYYHLKQRLDSTLAASCASSNVPFVNLADSIACTADDYYDFYHMTPRGARKVGEALFAKLRALPNF